MDSTFMSRDNFGPHLRVSKIRELRGQAGKENMQHQKKHLNPGTNPPRTEALKFLKYSGNAEFETVGVLLLQKVI